MGGTSGRRGASAPRRVRLALMIACGLAACGDDSAPDNVVTSADAITAVVAWQADEQEPVLDDNGEPEVPVIFVVADGTTIDVGVQAEVAAATTEWATVRFADDIADTFDSGLEGEPVRDGGAMLLVGPIPEPAPSIEIELVRYTAVDVDEVFTLEITTGAADDDVGPRASVTAVTQP